MSDQVQDKLARLGVSLPSKLLDELDTMISERGLTNRSQVIAELVRQAVTKHAAVEPGAVLAGTITMIYQNNKGYIRNALAQTQQHFIKETISSQHVFLEEDHSLEVLLVQGTIERLNDLCDQMRAIRGVHQINLVTTRTLLPPLHAHGDEPGEILSKKKGVK
ncbi:CopG family ribbon-helix-helix protein [Emcibacter nanhaiensis]|uniref:Putative nickel-responsive regulator n=1 Tax=Emcibacter nanhaiensis TaxID=1505037 RepID=A0A501PJ00_9PROT|nr:CopG family ribbon-helix-helix protein [Emcibacter nanhaiensis]TPD60195.1 CopG family ribbon-helix-helix protein [Emcibacter nanhaiensis]